MPKRLRAFQFFRSCTELSSSHLRSTTGLAEVQLADIYKPWPEPSDSPPVNIASTAAFQPLAGASVYAASKAFVLLFTEALSLELERTGVTITAACPGPVATHFFARMNPTLSPKEMDQPTPVVRDILRGFERGKRVVYPGKLANRLGTWGARFLPRNMILRLAMKTTRKLNRS